MCVPVDEKAMRDFVEQRAELTERCRAERQSVPSSWPQGKPLIEDQEFREGEEGEGEEVLKSPSLATPKPRHQGISSPHLPSSRVQGEDPQSE